MTLASGFTPSRRYVIERYRLSGAETGDSTLIDNTGAGVVGNAVTVPAGYSGIYFKFDADSGTTETDIVTVNGLAYDKGVLPPGHGAGDGSTFDEDISISVSGAALLEVTVARLV